jgi:hypothetical protein
VSQPSPGVLPYQVVYSGLCREFTRQLLKRAVAKGRLAPVAQAVRDINTRLEWIPLDFGEPIRDLVHLAMVEFIGALAPLVVTYFVDETRRIVFVTVPFKLLPRSGLETAPGSQKPPTR